MRLVILVVAAALVVATLVTVAAGSGEAPSPGVLVEWLRGEEAPPPAPTATAAMSGEGPSADRAVGTPRPPETAPEPPADLSGFVYPIAGACLPESDELLPNASREYRNGIHEGLDFYDADNCAAIVLNTEVVAARAGTVVRAGWDYEELTPASLAALEEQAAQVGWNDPEVLDVYRGRQVWIDHGDGVVTRYAHLNAIAEGIEVGAEVEQGQLIGYVGESGTPESVTEPGTQVHLHFELRVGDGFLGQGLDPATVRELYERAFSP